MPSSFGQLPGETIADLVAYVGTLKESETKKTTKLEGPKKPNFVIIFTDDPKRLSK